MTKCLVTKLNGSISNQEILKLGEVRIKIHRADNPSANTQKLYVLFNQDTKLEIIGDGYFTDVNLTLNKGKTLTVEKDVHTNIYVSNGDFILSISNKYALNILSDISTNKDIEYIESMPNSTDHTTDSMDNIDDRFGYVNAQMVGEQFTSQEGFFWDPIGGTDGIGTSLLPFDTAGNIRVLQVYWK